MHPNKCNICEYKESDKCNKCRNNYHDLFKPKELKDNEVFCISCKRVIVNGRIFKLVDDPHKGLCFDCY